MTTFKKLYEAGFKDLVSVIPPNAPLSPMSKIAADQAGKAPGRENNQGTWGGYDWQNYTPTFNDIERWDRSHANIGLKAGKYPAIDIDVVNESLARVISDMTVKALGAAPVRIGRYPKRLLMYRTTDKIGRMRIRFKDDKGVEQLVELLGDGQQYVIGGVHPITKEPYSLDTDLAARGPDALPGFSKEQVEDFFAELTETLELMNCEIIHADRHADNVVARSSVDQASLIAPNPDLVRELVEMIPNKTEHFPDRDDYIRMGYAIKAACGPEHEDDAYEIFSDWADKWEEGFNDPKFIEADFGRMHGPYEIGWEWLQERARAFGYKPEITEFETVDPEDAAQFGLAGPSEGPVEYSDIHLSERVARRHVSDIRYIPNGIGWIAWDGNRWAIDVGKKHIEYVTQVCRKASNEVLNEVGGAKGERIAARVAAVPVIFNVAKLLQTQSLMQASHEQLDADIYMLNTPAGHVDLRTGALSPHDRSKLCTKITKIAPDFDMPAPVWNAFLNEACNNDAELKAYLQRLSGYAATGSTKEHVFAFAYGSGGNGKGTWLNALGDVLHDYAAVASADVFLSSNQQRHTTELASLRGARLVRAQEIDPNRKWDEAKVKSLTGGDRISARFMRQDNFEFDPQFTLIIAGNTQPEITNVDDAMRRRIHLIPFVTKPARKDVDLPDKLKEEYPAILAWVIEGARMWLEEGLNPPKVVVDATRDYLNSEDVLQRWLEDRCVIGEAFEVSSSDAFEDFQEWVREENEAKGKGWSQKKFVSELKTKGHAVGHDRTRTKRVIKGFELLIGDDDKDVIAAMSEDDEIDGFFGIEINFKSNDGDEE